MTPYVVPFAIYIVLSLVAGYFENGAYFMYPIKTLLVAASLWYYRAEYPELRCGIRPAQVFTAAVVGVAVFAIWVIPEGWYPHLDSSEFNPFFTNNTPVQWLLIFFRTTGAALVVPVFEELFWRSFLLRWTISPDFKQVALGKFTWISFAVVALLFGFEHHRWLVGIVAGVIYAALLYREKNLWTCIVAHGVTNLALGLYVLKTGQWSFW